MSKIYIAGKITGTDDYMKRFDEAERFLNENGYEGRVINPAKVSAELPSESMEYRDYVDIGLAMLKTCDEIFMLDGWEESLGASLELQYALTMGYKVHYQNDIKTSYRVFVMKYCEDWVIEYLRWAKIKHKITKRYNVGSEFELNMDDYELERFKDFLNKLCGDNKV